jgi:hypothetical protein
LVEFRIKKPVDIPLSMYPGHIRTLEFRINSGPYIVEIAADQNKIPPDTLFCLLGYNQLDSQCLNTPSVVEASWVLSSGGAVMASGSSDDDGSGGGSVMDDGIGRSIGRFDGESGRRYALDVDILADGSKLAPGNPRLQVQEFPWYRARAALFSLIVVLEPMGIAFLMVSAARRWQARKLNPMSASIQPSLGCEAAYQRRRPPASTLNYGRGG